VKLPKRYPKLFLLAIRTFFCSKKRLCSFAQKCATIRSELRFVGRNYNCPENGEKQFTVSHFSSAEDVRENVPTVRATSNSGDAKYRVLCTSIPGRLSRVAFRATLPFPQDSRPLLTLWLLCLHLPPKSASPSCFFTFDYILSFFYFFHLNST
jgi:hypothetical protein